MARLDLDDLPPKIATLLASLAEGEELLLVQHGSVVGRLTADALAAPEIDEGPELPPEQRMAEVFETFRSAIEDEF
jgi:antitoxin (DNA-binding transcriptional repressor) of toxin-antitoxin stability system